MNEELYEALEQEFEKNHVDEDVEDVLLDLAEHMADQGIMLFLRNPMERQALKAAESVRRKTGRSVC